MTERLALALLLWSCGSEHVADGPDAAVSASDGAVDGDDANGIPIADASIADAPIFGPCAPIAVPSSGFVADEVYVENTNVACSSVCMVFHLAGNPDCPAGDARCAGPVASACFDATMGRSLCLEADDPSRTQTEPSSPDRVFRSCRCSAAGNPSLPLCTCPSNGTCVADTDPGGGYCVPTALVP